MNFAEDNSKVNRIVNGSYKYFEELYMPILLKYIEPINDDNNLYKFKDNIDKEYLIKKIPKNLRDTMETNDTTIFIDRNTSNKRLKDGIETGIKNIVSNSSWKHTLKSIFMNGFSKSFQYVLRKVIKNYNSRHNNQSNNSVIHQ